MFILVGCRWSLVVGRWWLVVSHRFSGGGIFLAARELCQRFIVLALLRRHVSRQLGLDGCIKVAMLTGLAHNRHTVSVQTEDRAVLPRRWNLQADRLSAQVGNLPFAAPHVRG